MKPGKIILENREIKRMMKLGNVHQHTKIFLREKEEKEKEESCDEAASECSVCKCSPCECESVEENLSVKKGTFPSQSKGSASAGEHGVPGAKSATKLPMGNNDGKMKPLATSKKNSGKGGGSPLSNLSGKKPSATGKDLSENRYKHLPDNEYTRLLREVDELEKKNFEDEEDPSQEDPSMNSEMPEFDDEVPEDMPAEEPSSVGGDKQKFVEFMNKIAQAASEVFGIPVEVSSDGEEGVSDEMGDPSTDSEMPEFDDASSAPVPTDDGEIPEFEEDEEEQKHESTKPVPTSAGKQMQMEGKKRRQLVHSLTMEVLQELKKIKKKK